MTNKTPWVSQIIEMTIIRFRPLFQVCVLLACMPIAAHANAIIPYMVVPWGQVYLLPLVILIEAVVIQRIMSGSFRSNFFQTLIANLASTALGALFFLITERIIGESLFRWWFKGEFSSEAIRSASIALLFAIFLWIFSWLSETALLIRLRKSNSSGNLWFACAIANLVTYALLLTLAIWLGRARSDDDSLARIDTSRNSQNIELQLRTDPKSPLVGFWRNQCTDDFGSAIEAASEGKYTIAFCGPGGCDKVEKLQQIDIFNNTSYRILDQNTIEEIPSGQLLRRCKINK